LIWERFERGAHRFDAAVGGTGLGLPIARALAVAHHGTLTYRDSDLLGGACFVLTLPNRVSSGRALLVR
jgi:signal transduction histidine kinase